MWNWRLDNLVSVQSNNVKLVETLKLIQPRSTSGSLAAYDNFNYTELYQFRKVFFQEVDETIVTFVKWYKLAPNQKTRFYTSIDGDEKSSNIELWRNEFYEIERDCLIPIHYLYSRFVSGEFVIGKKNPITYNAVIPINRQFHL
ncbi:hypothetical protein GLOIN_2v1786477 [Rhizophagus clarus]|uniref:Uncharacterized protein n=1 Tax=Rhizophagus clarus TaxID=94130 RepID=A0A8H3R1P9_9GLOM|nr:hypothetical protein GLOIN_2v1786477 [Rhizophagus clarus]